jgi:hypothetical protein
MIGPVSLRNLERPMSERASEVLRLVRSLDKLRRSRRFFVGLVPARADRDLFFQDSQLVLGWGFAPAMTSPRTRRARARS